MKNRSCSGEVTYKKGSVKKEVKKVNMVDALPVQD
jgi:hypothetical protein